MTGRIVVGTDGSEHARHALRWAAVEAQLRGARLTVVHAWSPPMPMSSFGPLMAPIDVSEYEQTAKALLEADITDAIETTGVPEAVFEPVFVRGYPPTTLLQFAEESDLLVVGSRGRGGFRGLLLGSTSQQCVSNAQGPVAVVRFEAPLPDRRDVVVGVDGSAPSLAALRLGMHEAAVRHARLVVAHAWWVEHPSSTSEALPFFTIDRGDYDARSRRLIQDMLDQAASDRDQCGPDAEVLAIDDAPAHALISLSAQAGVLVVGSRGRGGFAGMVLGSVSQQCVHHAHTAVVVVPSTA